MTEKGKDKVRPADGKCYCRSLCRGLDARFQTEVADMMKSESPESWWICHSLTSVHLTGACHALSWKCCIRRPDYVYEDTTTPAHSFSQVNGIKVTMHCPSDLSLG